MSFTRVHAQSLDEPDFLKEKKFYNLYKNLNSKPTDEQLWTGVVSGKPQVYSIQDEDTLWDLSETLFGDSKYWPKVWSLNSEKIENPHEIFPGQVVQFTPGTTADAPSVAIRQKSEAEAAQETLTVETPENKELLSRAQIPPQAPKKPVTLIPGSIPSWTMGARKPQLQFEVQPRSGRVSFPDEDLTYFIESRGLAGIGTVAETELTGNVAGDFQIVYVKLSGPPNDKTVLAVKDVGEIEDPQDKSKSHVIQVQGEIEILEPVNSGENIYRALVKKTVNPVEVGSQLVVGEIPKFNLTHDSFGSAKAQIIGGQHGAERKILEYNSLVFLKGQGLAIGQTYPIFKRQILRNPKTRSFENPRRIGQVKILRVSDRLATGVILESTEEIHVGDVTSPQP